MCVLLWHLSYGAGDMATLICARGGGGGRILLQGNNTQQLLLLFNFHGNWLFIAEKCNLDIQVEVEQNPYARTLSICIPGPDRIPGNAFKIPLQISGTSMAADEGGGRKNNFVCIQLKVNCNLLRIVYSIVIITTHWLLQMR